MSIHLSVVIPAYNEEKVIGSTITRVASYLESVGQSELIVVDDGSRDSTTQVVKGMMLDHPCVRLVEAGKNGGKGKAVKLGVLSSRGEYVLYTDADLVYPIEGAEPFVAALQHGADVAIGCRSHPDTLFALNPRHFSYIYQRYLVGRAYIRTVNLLLGLGVQDTQCGFKAFRGDVARDLFSRTRACDFAFDVEVLYVARLLGHRIAELPVYFLYLGEQSSVELIGDSLRMLRDLLIIRRNGRKGIYATTHLEHPASVTG
ncbi:MAG: glycosyltransferase family 2 protein [Chloroflexi bacterium]|nr:glycosyltransferase family 2 protein [Chloroflexota bacterium]